MHQEPSTAQYERERPSRGVPHLGTPYPHSREQSGGFHDPSCRRHHTRDLPGNPKKLSEVKRLRETMKFSSLGQATSLASPINASDAVYYIPPLAEQRGGGIQTLPTPLLPSRRWLAAELRTLCTQTNCVQFGHGKAAKDPSFPLSPAL